MLAVKKMVNFRQIHKPLSRGFSKFENYTDTSSYYDTSRIPVGTDVILSQLKSQKDAMVLDAGAGSGNYRFELSKSVKKIVAFEMNDGMISQMRSKKEKGQVNNVEIVQGSLTSEMSEIESLKGKFDLVTCNMVIHHLD